MRRQWWCRMDELGRPAIEAMQGARVRFHPESQHRFAIDSLENAPDWCLSRQLWWGHQLPIWKCPNGHITVAWPPPERCGDATPSSSSTREPGRARHVVLLGAVAARDPRLAGADARARPLLPGQRERDRARDHPALGEPDDLQRALPAGRGPVHRRDHHFDRARRGRAAHVEEPRHGIDPLEAVAKHGADATRYGLLKISATQDVRFSWGAIEEGQKLANKLWNVARLILQHAEGVTPELRPQAVEETWILRRIDDSRGELETLLPRLRLRTRRRVALPPRLRRVLRLVRRGDQAAAVRERRGSDRDRARRARAAARAPAPGDAARHRGDLVAVPRLPPDRRAVARARPGLSDAADALARVQEAAAIFRRSGVVRALAGDEKRIFDAVVEPERAKATGDVEAERARLRKEIARSEGMLANEKFVQNARRRGRPGRAREARALPERAGRSLELRSGARQRPYVTLRCGTGTVTEVPQPPSLQGKNAIAGSGRHTFATVPGTGHRRRTRLLGGEPLAVARAVRPRADAHAACRPRQSAAALSGDPCRGDERQDLDDPDDRRASADAGLRAGAYISPHVRGWPERIQVDGRAVDLEPALARVRPYAAGATQFEVLTAAALAEFAASEVDAAVVEAGLGGRHDATNVLRRTCRCPHQR